MRLAVVLLAAGQSRRFGEADKLLEAIGGTPMAARVMDTLRALDAGRRFAVVSRDEVAALALRRGFEPVRNEEPERGMALSIALGVRAAERAGADAVLLAAADQPRLTAASLRALAEGFVRGGGRLACLADETHFGNPAIFSMDYAPELCALEGDRGAKAVLRRHERELVRVPCTLARELEDADDPEALRRMGEEPLFPRAR